MRNWILVFGICVAPEYSKLPATTQTAVDETAAKLLAQTGVPSASITVVAGGKIAYVQTYGDARLDPKTPARPEMRYKIASNSKQIAATAILLLAEQNKISLDDPVARFLPQLTRAQEVTIRQLLSHTSGYQDYYPLDYVAPFMVPATTPQHILDLWAKKPLDFEPGTQWQYSNTNYVIVGQIIEKITGKPLIDFLRARIFEPLGMHTPMTFAVSHGVSRTPPVIQPTLSVRRALFSRKATDGCMRRASLR
jgi:D-alanyl-D-alanine carboxypeptidase